MVDVGLSFNAPNSIGYLKRNPHSVVLGIEPNPLHFVSYFAGCDFAENLWIFTNEGPEAREEIRRRRRNPFLRNTGFAKQTEEFLPRDLRQRFIFLPVAIALTEGWTPLFISSHQGSSSLNATWPGVTPESKQIPVWAIPLESVISMIHPRFEWLAHLKVDAEGEDLAVLQSAGSGLKRFAFVSVEDESLGDFLTNNGFQLLSRHKAGVTFANKTFPGDSSEFDLQLRV